MPGTQLCSRRTKVGARHRSRDTESPLDRGTISPLSNTSTLRRILNAKRHPHHGRVGRIRELRGSAGRGRDRSQALSHGLRGLRPGRRPAARRPHRPRGPRRVRRIGRRHGARHRRKMGSGLGIVAQRAHDPGDGLQRHLLETGSVAPVGHHPGRHGRRRTRRADRAAISWSASRWPTSSSSVCAR